MPVANPGVNSPLVDNGGRITQPWLAFLQQFFVANQTPVGSTFPFTAPTQGTLALSGGSTTSIIIERGTTFVPTGMVQGLIPLLQGDTVTIIGVPASAVFLPG